MMYEERLDLIRAISKYAIIFIIVFGAICGVIQILSECIPFAGPAVLLIALSIILRR